MTFTEQIYALVRRIPRPGRHLWADSPMGRPPARPGGGSRHEPLPLCGRSLPSGAERPGRTGPFPAFGTGDGQRLLLEMEGIPVSPDGRVELSLYVWRPEPWELRLP